MFLNTDPKDIEVLAFIDNDTRKQGNQIDGITIYGPEYIQQSGAEVVCVASCFQKEIIEQLTQYIGLPENMIRVVGIDETKSTLDPTDQANLRGELRRLIQAFEDANLSWWLDHSSLLNLLRCGEFINGYDDVDLCILEKDAAEVRKIVSSLFPTHEIQLISFDETYACPFWKTGDLGHIKIGRGLDIQIKFSQADSVYWHVGPFVLQASASFYLQAELRNYFDMSLRLPADPLAYLSHLYGASWQQPQQGWSYADYGNIVTQFKFVS